MDKKPSEAAVQRALNTIANIDKDKIKSIFSKMKFDKRKESGMGGTMNQRYKKIDEASRG